MTKPLFFIGRKQNSLNLNIKGEKENGKNKREEKKISRCPRLQLLKLMSQLKQRHKSLLKLFKPTMLFLS